jgi:hypothetical protein
MNGEGTPSTALRLGAYKVLVGCFNITTMRPESAPLTQVRAKVDCKPNCLPFAMNPQTS